MKKVLIFRIIAVVLVTLVIAGAITFAWYINTRKTKSIDIDSTGISISYKINSNNQTNEETYDINNVAFFDITSQNEAYYLPSMAVSFKLNIVNYSTQAVDVSVYQNTQSYHLGTDVDDGTLSVYKYTKTFVTKNTYDQNTHFVYNNDSYKYSSPASFISGEDYYTREKLFDADPTITTTNNVSKITEIDLGESDYTYVIDGDGLGFAVEEFVVATNLTQEQFNLNGAIFYTYEDSKYTVAKEYDSSKTYYEKRTVAYLSDFTISANKITEVNYSVTGAYVTCIVADATKLTSSGGTYVLPSVAEANKYSTSVESYLTTKTMTHSYTTPNKLASGALNTAGGEKDVYVFVYGVQPYQGATNNFLDNSKNVYPVSLIIEAK